MKVLVTGATGLIGSALLPKLRANGHDVGRLLRSGNATGLDALWNPRQGSIDLEEIEGFDAVIHLAGENIASGRWNAARKDRILQSRVQGTRLLSEALARLKTPPKVLVSSSAIGYYGDRGSELLTENSDPGRGFLTEVCKAWESSTEPAADKGIRVVCIRTGIVLSTQGGALAKMLTPFRLGAGGKIGSGDQYMSWISLHDLCRIFIFAVESEGLSGPVNAVTPSPVTNAAFTKSLGAALNRPTIFPLPAFAARLALGEMADALLLASTRVVPRQLEDAGFVFQDTELGPTLKKIVSEKL